MVNSRSDTRLDELEKATEDLEQGRLLLDAAVKELNAQFRRTDDQVKEVRSELTAMLQEMRAGFASLKLKDTSSPEDGSTSTNRELKTASTSGVSASPMPTFDGSDALAWLARAEQYFLISETPSEDRVGIAMVALAGAALPWYQLLRQRVPDLTWARFARELMKRFGGNGALNEYKANSTTGLFPNDSSNGHGSNTKIPGGIPPITIPTFDGSEALAWLARANQYFLINKTPLDRRVDVAINAISGPAMPWLKLLLMRCSSLSWDKFTQELLRRFGDAADRVAKIQPKITPTSNDSTAVVSPYPSAAMASKNPPDEVPFPKLSVASNGQAPKEHKVSILRETASECGLKVTDVFEDPYMGIVPVSAPSSSPLPPPPVLEFNSSSHVSSERQMKHSAKELCFSRSLFGASSHKPGNQLVHRPHRQINIYKLEFEPPPDLHLQICLALRTRLF